MWTVTTVGVCALAFVVGVALGIGWASSDADGVGSRLADAGETGLVGVAIFFNGIFVLVVLAAGVYLLGDWLLW